MWQTIAFVGLGAAIILGTFISVGCLCDWFDGNRKSAGYLKMRRKALDAKVSTKHVRFTIEDEEENTEKTAGSESDRS
jgi:hypothetical protein